MPIAKVLVILAFTLLLMPFQPASAAETPSGLPLPRFVTTRSEPINVRVGPGTRYGVAWIYVKAGVPVENMIAMFDTAREAGRYPVRRA